MLIVISGKSGSGKDTVGGILYNFASLKKLKMKKAINQNTDSIQFCLDNLHLITDFGDGIKPNLQFKKFADKLKDICCILFNCTREQLEDQNFKKSKLPNDWEIDNHLPTYREALQKIGTELFRNNWNKDTWTICLLQDYNEETDNYIITDMRFFDNEYKSLAVYDDKFFIKVVRDDCNKFDNQHSSENEIDDHYYDAIIYNNSSFEDLIVECYNKCYHIIDNIKNL